MLVADWKCAGKWERLLIWTKINLFNKNLLPSNELWHKCLGYFSGHLLIKSNHVNTKIGQKNPSQYVPDGFIQIGSDTSQPGLC